MKLVTEPLISELEQSFSFKLEGRCLLAAIAPYLYMHNAPAGEFQFSIFKGEELVMMKLFDATEIKSSLSSVHNYAHVYYPMVPTNPIFFTKGDYRAVLNATGYTYSPNSFLGWIRAHENIQDELEYTPSDDGHNPFTIRRKILKQGISI